MVKSWLVQDQTVLVKDYSILLIADSLLKTIWFINAPCYGNEALASPKANGIWYGYFKNHKKTVKNGQARTRELEEYKAEAKKVKPQSKSAKKSQKLAQHVTSKNDMLAIRRCPQINPTAQDQYLIIEGIDG
ncbi:hypothetical protein Tco_0259928 [Tanacetum coccineum]